MTTPWQTIGPFFHHALPYQHGPDLVPDAAPGAIELSGHVFDGNDDPVTDALIEIWHSDPRGTFPQTGGIHAVPGAFRGFGRCATNHTGRYRFRTLIPGPVPTLDGTPQAPHIAVSVFARGLLRRAVTRIYLPGHPANAGDPLLASIEPDRRDTLVALHDGAGLRFDIHLQGPRETVFLHV